MSTPAAAARATIDPTSYLLGWLTVTERQVARLDDDLSNYAQVFLGRDGDPNPGRVMLDAARKLRGAAKMLANLEKLTDPDTSDRDREVARHMLESS